MIRTMKPNPFPIRLLLAALLALSLAGCGTPGAVVGAGASGTCAPLPGHTLPTGCGGY